jgi:UDP-N-acetylglucosamine 4,6-dehydratase
VFGGFKKFLITGGTGTFGRAMATRLIEGGAERVVLLARHEAEMALSEAVLGQLPGAQVSLRCFLGDVRDRDRLEMAFRNVDAVFHSAALKRIEQCQRDPIEAVRTNVVGTQCVIEAALRSDVRRLVGLSTDKACNPVNLYGATKLTAEHLLLAANALSAGRCSFSVVRYGNVWASRGSVIHQWKAQVSRGEPLRITDPEATRYFMRINEAVDLVLDALHNPRTDRVILADRLPAYRVGDLLDAFMLVHACPNHPVSVIGLPAFEKLHETMDGVTDSSQTWRMTSGELRELICQVE